MSPARHQRLMEHFDAACDRDATAQAAYLAALAAEDGELAEALAGLLRHDRERLPGATGAAMVVPPGFLQGAPLPTGSLGPAPPDPEPEPPTALPDLELLSPLAEGGMGRIWLARQRSLQREVAVKLLKPGAAAAWGPSLDPLLREAELAGSLEHPSIVPVHLLLRDERGLPVLVMKRVEGVSWGRLLREPEHPAWQTLLSDGSDRLAVHLSILGRICHALAYAHSRGVLHRDVKPDNVMVGAFGEVYLLDWGIAARLPVPALGPGHVLGTPGYLAPEMARGEAQDPRTDVYLLGATLHQVLTGTPRHLGATVAEQLCAARESAPQRYGPEVPEELAELCNRATSADPAGRPPSAEAFRQCLLEHLNHRSSIDLAEEAWARLRALRTRLGAAAPGEVREIYQLISECQFGFHHSLRAWPGNARAQAGQRQCLITLVSYEVAGENLQRAQALLETLEDPPPELLGQVAELGARAQRSREREAALAALERGRDWRVGATQRALFFLCTAAILFSLYVHAVHVYGSAPDAMAPAVLARYSGVALGGLAVLVVVFRRYLLSTTVARQLVLGVLCTISAMCLSRALFAIPAPITATVVSVDQVLAATACALGGLTLMRGLHLLAPLFLLGALGSRLFPAQAGHCFVACACIAVLLGLYLTFGLRRL